LHITGEVHDYYDSSYDSTDCSGDSESEAEDDEYDASEEGAKGYTYAYH